MGEQLDLVPAFLRPFRLLGLVVARKRSYAVLGFIGFLMAVPSWIAMMEGAAEGNEEKLASGSVGVVEAEIDDALPLGLNPGTTVVTVFLATLASVASPMVNRRLRSRQ